MAEEFGLSAERLIVEGFGISIGWFETETYRSKYASADATFRKESSGRNLAQKT